MSTYILIVSTQDKGKQETRILAETLNKAIDAADELDLSSFESCELFDTNEKLVAELVSNNWRKV